MFSQNIYLSPKQIYTNALYKVPKILQVLEKVGTGAGLDIYDRSIAECSLYTFEIIAQI